MKYLAKRCAVDWIQRFERSTDTFPYHNDTVCPMGSTLFEALVERAAEHQGIVTTNDARSLGIDPTQLRILAHRGKLERIGRGVYRVIALPLGRFLPYAEAVAWAPEGSSISHESALAIRELGDFNPTRIDVTVPRGYRPRRKVPRTLRLRQPDLDQGDIDMVDGVPTAAVLRAILQVIEAGSDPYQVRRAISDAYRQGHIGGREAERMRRTLTRSKHRAGSDVSV